MAEEKEKPLTRKDVLRLIEENGGTAKGLDLSEKVFVEQIDLSSLDLSGIKLQKARLFFANLQGTGLVGANLQNALLLGANLQESNLAVANLQDANLEGSNLQGTNLAGANLQGASLRTANMQGARLLLADLRRIKLCDANLKGAMLEGVKWGPKYIVGDEPEFEKGITKDARHELWRYELLRMAASVYRNLKRCHIEQGLYDIAGKFYYREMEVETKMLKWRANPLSKMQQRLYWLLCGYGEKPWQVVLSAAVVVLGLTIAYYFWGSFSSSSFWDTLYYSATSFTALGYGKWALQPTGWAKGMGAAEAIIGVFLMALFLVTFVRKLAR